MVATSTPEQQKERQLHHNKMKVNLNEQLKMATPIDDDIDTRIIKKQKMDNTPPATLSPLSSTFPSPTHSAMTATSLMDQSLSGDDKDGSTTDRQTVNEDEFVDALDHFPDTLEIINRVDSSLPRTFTDVEINPIHPKSSNKQKKSSRRSSESPYSFNTPPKSTDMTRDQIKYCGAIMRNLKKHRDATPFSHPVDYVKLNIPDYPTIIKQPIDLSTIDRKLQHGDYNHVNQFVDDIRLLFNNCYKFNGPEANISMLCQNVESAFEKSLRQMPPSKKGGQSSPQHQCTSQPGVTTSFRRINETPPEQKRRAGSQYANRRCKKIDIQLKFCGQALRELKKNKYKDFSYPFLLPVDAVALNIPDYHTIITHPMDISTIERNLNKNEYESPESFESDIRLMFNNCYRYNPPNLPIYKMAKELERIFDEKWKLLPNPEPTPPPPTAAAVATRKAETYDSSSSSSSDESDESDSDDRIAELERHIATISQQIASMKSNKKKTTKHSTKQKATTKKSPAAAPKPPQRRRPTPSARKQQFKPSSSSTTTTTTTTTTQDHLPEFTFDQKKDLSESINNLTGDRLNTVVSIIQSSMPNLDGGQEEIVLDIDALDRKTLHRLHEFVTGNNLARPIDKKRKSVDSEHRIRALEESLKQFENAQGQRSSSESDSGSSSGSESDDSGSNSD